MIFVGMNRVYGGLKKTCTIIFKNTLCQVDLKNIYCIIYLEKN